MLRFECERQYGFKRQPGHILHHVLEDLGTIFFPVRLFADVYGPTITTRTAAQFTVLGQRDNTVIGQSRKVKCPGKVYREFIHKDAPGGRCKHSTQKGSNVASRSLSLSLSSR